MLDLSACTKPRRWMHKVPSARATVGKNPTVGCRGQGSNPRRAGRPQPPLTNQASIWFTPVRPPSPVSGLWDYVVGPSLHHGGIVAVPTTTTWVLAGARAPMDPCSESIIQNYKSANKLHGKVALISIRHIMYLCFTLAENPWVSTHGNSLFQPIIHVNSANRQVNQLMLTHP
jgi:hypothetical protein